MVQKKQIDDKQAADDMLRNIPGGLHLGINDPYLTIFAMSDSFPSMFGYTREEIGSIFEYKFINMIYPEDRVIAHEAAREMGSGREEMELEYRVKCRDGRLMWVLDRARATRLADGRQGFYCVMLDITERKKTEEKLRLSLERYKLIMDQTTDIVFEWNIEDDSLVLTPNWRKKFGYEAVHENISREIPKSKRIHPEDLDFFLKILQDTADGVPYSETEFRIQDSWGNFIWCRIRATVLYNQNKKPIKAVGIIMDIDEEKKQTQKLMERVDQDALTGLFNKTACGREIKKRMQNGKNGVLIIVDLDNFKSINDKFGHLYGDAVLSDAAAILKHGLGKAALTGRIGGDEFMAFLPEISREEGVNKAEEVCEKLRGIVIDGKRNRVSASIGAAFYPLDADNYFELYRKADLALYVTKAKGKNGVTMYDGQENIPERKDGPGRLVAGTVIESEKAGTVNEKLLQYGFQMLYSSFNIETAVNHLLEITGRSFDVSRVYIFESSPDGRYCSNTFEWCNEGVIPQIGNLQHLSYEEDLGGYTRNFDENGIFYCKDIRQLDKILYDILAPQGICSMLQCAILDDREFKGYVGFDECKEYRYWEKEQIEALIFMANILSIFLLKYRMKKRVKQLEEELLLQQKERSY